MRNKDYDLTLDCLHSFCAIWGLLILIGSVYLLTERALEWGAVLLALSFFGLLYLGLARSQ